MNDTLLQMVASQLGIPSTVIEELKAAKPQMRRAEFDGDTATLFVEVSNPKGNFEVMLTLPVEQLRRFPAFYLKAAQLAHR
jgi:hypothetical protein